MEGLMKPSGGRVRNIGIANFSPSQLNSLLEVATIKPLVHQIELHPYLPQSAFLEDNQIKGILVMGYAPLANTNPAYKKWSLRTQKILTHPIITEIARLRNCTPAQVVLAWNLRRNVIVIPKAANPAHQLENIKADKCRITKQDDWEINTFAEKTQFRMNGDVCTPEPMSNGCWDGLALGM
jgi:alcohol dehydrogenase (NADP+)